MDGQGNLFIGDSGNNMVRKVPVSTGIINAVAGMGTGDYSGDGVPATQADVNGPDGVVVDGAGNLFIGDTSNSRVRKVAGSTGLIATVAGNGNCCSSGDGGAATQAAILYPEGVARDGQGDLFIADYGTHRVREVIASTGVITTVAGNGTAGFSGDGGAATAAELNNPRGLTLDAGGNLFVADTNDNRVREVLAGTGIITTVAGNGASGFSGDGGAATAAKLNWPEGVAKDGSGDLYIADTINNRVREVGRLGTATNSYTYGYDGAGNLTSNNGITQTYDAANQLTAVGPITYTFDADGNQTKTSKLTAPAWGYDAQNHSTSYSDTNALDTFLTTAQAQRETKALTSTLYGTTRGTYDAELMGLGLYRQTAPTTRTIYYERDPNGRLLVLTDGRTVYYYGRDGHGSVVNLTDRNGEVQNSYRYDPYGNMLSTAENATLANPWRYGDGYWDAESGLYLLGVRYYDPATGRFLQPDPLGVITQYSYAGDDPCDNSDPSVEAPIKPCVGMLKGGDVTVSFGPPTYGRPSEPGRLFWHVKPSTSVWAMAAVEMTAASVNGRAINPPYGQHIALLPYDFHGSMLNYNYVGRRGGGTLHAGDVVQFTWYVLGTDGFDVSADSAHVICRVP